MAINPIVMGIHGLFEIRAPPRGTNMRRDKRVAAWICAKAAVLWFGQRSGQNPEAKAAAHIPLLSRANIGDEHK